MNKKGITLIEIIGVITILSLIALLAFPPMLKMVKNSEKEITEATKSLIYTASSQYTAKYMNDFPKVSGNIYCLTINDLVKENYLSSSIVDKNITLETKVKVSISQDNKYEYIIDNGCVEVR